LIIANSHNLSLNHVQRWCMRPSPPSSDSAEALCRTLNRAAVDVARKVGCGVAACLASPDTPYATSANLTADEVADRLLLQYEALAASDPDLIIFEMLTTPSDIRGVAQLVSSRGAAIPVAVGLVAAGAEGTLGGASWADARDALEPLAPSVVFIQCTPVERVEPALAALSAGWPEATLGVYANDGGYDASTQSWSGARATPQDYAAAAQRWVSAGARVVGGCCGTGPAHIAAIRAALKPAH
ncbi:MAG: homocysteine S-methyltransferase family protein, partial [Myxococcota bacterium]